MLPVISDKDLDMNAQGKKAVARFWKDLYERLVGKENLLFVILMSCRRHLCIKVPGYLRLPLLQTNTIYD